MQAHPTDTDWSDDSPHPDFDSDGGDLESDEPRPPKTTELIAGLVGVCFLLIGGFLTGVVRFQPRD